jgi:hypothetical protein
VGVVSGGSVVLVVFWGRNQGDVSWGMRLVCTRNGSVDGFLCIGLVDREDFWISMDRLGSYVMFGWLTLGSSVSLGAVRRSWLST